MSLNRQPPGSPVGGQFAQSTRGEPDISSLDGLGDWAVYGEEPLTTVADPSEGEGFPLYAERTNAPCPMCGNPTQGGSCALCGWSEGSCPQCGQNIVGGECDLCGWGGEETVAATVDPAPCPQCGQASDGSRECDLCGWINEDWKAPSSPVELCDLCGAELMADSDNCDVCGQDRLVEDNSPQASCPLCGDTADDGEPCDGCINQEAGLCRCGNHPVYGGEMCASCRDDALADWLNDQD